MLIQLTSVHGDVAAAIERHRKAVQTARRRAIDILAIDVVVRAMSWAFEAVAVVAEWHLAAQMHADLIERQPEGVTFFEPVLRLH